MTTPARTRVRMAMRRGAFIISAGLSAFAGSNVHAEIFRCADADGHAVFSDKPCGTAAEKVEVVDSSSGLAPITGDGLSRQEHNVLEAAAAADAQRADQSGSGGPSPQGAAPAAAAPRRGY